MIAIVRRPAIMPYNITVSVLCGWLGWTDFGTEGWGFESLRAYLRRKDLRRFDREGLRVSSGCHLFIIIGPAGGSKPALYIRPRCQFCHALAPSPHCGIDGKNTPPSPVESIGM